MKIFLGVKSWAVYAAATVVAAVWVGCVVSSYLARRRPEPPAECVEKAEVVQGNLNAVWECAPPGRVSVAPVAHDGDNKPYFSYRCTCPRVGMGREDVEEIVGEMLGRFEQAPDSEVEAIVASMRSDAAVEAR